MSFGEGVNMIDPIKRALEELRPRMDAYRLLLFDYKFAYLHFAVGEFEEALDLSESHCPLQEPAPAARLADLCQLAATYVSVRNTAV